MLEAFVVLLVLLHTPGKPASKLEISEPAWKRREKEENTYFLGCHWDQTHGIEGWLRVKWESQNIGKSWVDATESLGSI